MRCLKIKMDGITASFRYPHFIWGRQPTFEAPPPATIYGMICSAVGEWLDPNSIQFAYSFSFSEKLEDLEHVHAVQFGKGTFTYLGKKYSKNIEGNINPLRREFLFRPEMTLYLDRLDLEPFFWEPRYPMTFGRSQDLLFIKSISTIELMKETKVYLEKTILPWEYRPYVTKGISLMMPKYIDYDEDRRADLANYVLLTDRVYDGLHGSGYRDLHTQLMIGNNEVRNYWIDVESNKDHDCFQGVVFHSFVD